MSKDIGANEKKEFLESNLIQSFEELGFSQEDIANSLQKLQNIKKGDSFHNSILLDVLLVTFQLMVIQGYKSITLKMTAEDQEAEKVRIEIADLI